MRVGGEDGGGLEDGGLRRELELELLVPAGGGRRGREWLAPNCAPELRGVYPTTSKRSRRRRFGTRWTPVTEPRSHTRASCPSRSSISIAWPDVDLATAKVRVDMKHPLRLRTLNVISSYRIISVLSAAASAASAAAPSRLASATASMSVLSAPTSDRRNPLAEPGATSEPERFSCSSRRLRCRKDDDFSRGPSGRGFRDGVRRELVSERPIARRAASPRAARESKFVVD